MPGKDKSLAINLPGIGKQIAKYLARLNIHSLQDLLLHLPLRYQDRTQITPIRALVIGQEAVIEGVIQSLQTPMKGRTKLLCDINDGTAKLQLRFFHIFAQQKNMLQPGNRVRCYGEVRLGMKGLEIFHPEFKVLQPDTVLPVEKYLTPIYPATEGLTQYMLRKLTSNALTQTQKIFTELLPDSILKELNFPQIEKAIHDVHRPTSDTDINHLHATKSNAQQRLIFEELLAHRISLLHVKQLFQQHQAIALMQYEKLRVLFLKNLSFKLTNAQQRVVEEITQDLQCSKPMLR